MRLKAFPVWIGQDQGNAVQAHQVPDAGRDRLQNIP